MLAGVVTLYHPQKEMVEHILGYIDCLDVLFVSDNSEQKKEEILAPLKKHEKVVYLDNHGNKGISYALNGAVRECKKREIHWLLMMDQDSVISEKTVSQMYDYAVNAPEDVAIVASNYKKNIGFEGTKELSEVITSGTMLNVDICEKLGGFLEELFIDEVDNEYCLRLMKNHYRIIRLNYAVFEHHLGEYKMVHKVATYNYTPVRYYYIIRNNFYVASLYKDVFPEKYKLRMKIIRNWIKSVLYEKDTITKWKYMYRGYRDYKNGKMGVFVEK